MKHEDLCNDSLSYCNLTTEDSWCKINSKRCSLISKFLYTKCLFEYWYSCVIKVFYFIVKIQIILK